MANEFVVKHGLISKGNIVADSSVTASTGFRGNLTGTASNAVSSSYSLYANSSSYSFDASNAVSSLYSFSNLSSSWASSSISASHSATSLLSNVATIANGISFEPSTASYARQSISASYSFDSLLENWMTDNAYNLQINADYTVYKTRYDYVAGTTTVLQNGIELVRDLITTPYDYAESGSRYIALHFTASVFSKMKVKYRLLDKQQIV